MQEFLSLGRLGDKEGLGGHTTQITWDIKRGPMALQDESLGIDQLSVDYDYLVYRISDRVKSLELEVTRLVQRQNELVGQVSERVIDENIERFRGVLRGLDELEEYFAMMEQIGMITDSFKERLDSAMAALK